MRPGTLRPDKISLLLKSDGYCEKKSVVTEMKKASSFPIVPCVIEKKEGSSGSKSKSHSSSSSGARIKQMEYEAAQERARIELAEAAAGLELARTKARLEKDLLEKKLAADIAIIEQGDSRRSESSSSSNKNLHLHQKIEEWLDKSVSAPGSSLKQHQVISRGGDGHHCTDGGAAPAPEPRPREPEADTRTHYAIEALADALRDAVGTSTSKNENRELMTRLATSKDLPLYSGDPLEWLHFKEAFYESTNLCRYSDTENLWRLRKCLRGDAKEAATSLLMGSTSPSEVMEILELRFGRPECIMRKVTWQLRKLNPLPPNYQNEIVNFAIKIKNLVTATQAVQQSDYLRSPELISIVVSKLPTALISKWAEYLDDKKSCTTPKLEMLSSFLYDYAKKIATSGVSYVNCQSVPTDNKKKLDTNKNQTQSHNVLVCTTDGTSQTTCNFCKKQNHVLKDCTKFKRALRRDRWRFVRVNKLCFKCLETMHKDSTTCTADNCDIDGCGLGHHRLLHWSRSRKAQQGTGAASGSTSEPCDEEEADAGEVVTHVAAAAAAPSAAAAAVMCQASANKVCVSKKSQIVLKIVPVTIHGPNGSVHAHALLDDGASVTLIESGLAEEAGLHGEVVTMRARSAWDSSELVCKSELINFAISNTDGQKFKLSARKLKVLNLPLSSNVNFNLERYKVMCDNYKFCYCDLQPKLLIGQDNYDLIAPIVCFKYEPAGPYVTKTSLGWCVHGSLPVNNINKLFDKNNNKSINVCSDSEATRCRRSSQMQRDSPSAHTASDAYLFHISDNDNTHDIEMYSNAKLFELISRSYSLDSIGINSKPRQNVDESRALAILDKSAVLSKGQWSVGLPWKYDSVNFPESLSNAVRRLKSIERKIAMDSDYGARYRERVEHLLVNNYARELTQTELVGTCSRIWYLPHFGVDNPNKKKLRLVFDAASRSNGFSLNDFLLQGPDLLNSLYGIMFRFRENPIGVIGDIKDMFLRIKIQRADQNALRFVWKDTDGQLRHYAMTSLLFGANCSPFVAQFVNQHKNASRFQENMPEAVKAIQKNQYMDDYIDSFSNKDIAHKIIKEISYINKQGGFEMCNWLSNEKQVLIDLPKQILNDKALRFNIDDQPERALGLLWFPSDDTLGFDLSFKRIPQEICNFQRKPTKRELLGIVMSIFDIHGYLGPFTIKGKIMMRDTWTHELKWDDEIGEKLFVSFRDWMIQSKEISHIRIPRWYFRNTEIPTRSYQLSDKSETNFDLHLHVFCDASPRAFCAVAFWRKVYSDGRVQVSFIVSKSKVTPLKSVSIPRLELQAALLACKLANGIKQEHRIIPTSTYYWTDSITVLYWIRNKARNYKTFIANRLGEIDDLSSFSEWNYVPTDMNIADICTKTTNYELGSESEWFRGPSFLYQPQSCWPRGPEMKGNISEDILETVHTVCDFKLDDLPVPSSDRFSSWLRLVRTTATVLLFTEKCKRRHVTSINEELMCKAELLLLRQSQLQSFKDEILALQHNKEIKQNSRLRTLTPFIDKDNLLRVGSRIGAAKDIDVGLKYPIILDGKNHVSRLIVTHYHVRAAHSCNEMVINELRQKYWIVNLRPTVRTVAKQCVFCRIKRASPSVPRLGDLPEGRLSHHQRPFTMCGLDLFGPLAVAVGRQRAQRYGVLFTCLTVRAVHIETVTSLSTDSLIMALRRMAARRGWPHTLFSDNGTNLRGANTELTKAYKEVLDNQDVLVSQALNKGVNWKFIPPVSPHMGGAWERLIRSVKTALKVVLKERAPREETLETFLCEVENIINSRPLTHVSVDPRDCESLTPNHFLIGSSSNIPQPGVFDDGDLYLRKQWRIAQRLADMFWSRWVKEVLPTMAPRSKWCQEGIKLKEGDLVIVVDPSSPRNCWPKGIVVKTYPGKDNRVRIVDIKTKSGLMKRPVTRVALLLGNECRNRDTGGQDVADGSR